MEWLAGLIPTTILAKVLVAFATPFVLKGAKEAVRYVDRALPKHAIPTLALPVGAVLEVLLQGLSDAAIPGLPPGASGALLGLAGVGLRELYDQWKQYIKFGPSEAQ